MEHKHQRAEAAEARAANVEVANEQRAVVQRTNQKQQPIARPALDTDTTTNNYNLFLAKWERYRDGCLKPHDHNESRISLQL